MAMYCSSTSTSHLHCHILDVSCSASAVESQHQYHSDLVSTVKTNPELQGEFCMHRHPPQQESAEQEGTMSARGHGCNHIGPVSPFCKNYFRLSARSRRQRLLPTRQSTMRHNNSRFNPLVGARRFLSVKMPPCPAQNSGMAGS
jgi:hypothetical protein